ncbi:putative glycolipid-binding domain-containing protein [Gordonia sp. (in: high G+C Gram-positive bacteria)]|uniref:putative glycolipid-binding domain-containing protein n=1 Tax=Gordonia sp. (in: high G+C Gram-positive bacteria) TaxID=84139 RepID=UPI003C770FFC
MTSFDASPTDAGVKAMLTWRSSDNSRLEQVRLNLNGSRVRAYGRIVAAATDDSAAYSASYELVTNDSGVTRRLSVRVLRADGDSALDLSRDMDGRWMVQTPTSTVRSDFDGAEVVDLELSPFFKGLPVRRFGITPGVRRTDLPVVTLRLPDCEIDSLTKSYVGLADGRVEVIGPKGSKFLTVNDAGVVSDYSGIASLIG